MSLRFLRPCWLAVFVAGLLYGQADLATVTGVVTDAAKAVIPGVTITIRNTETGISHTATSNHDGYFTVSQLDPGHYELTAINKGFETYKETNIVLQTGGAVRVPVTMAVGSVNETVSVTADAITLHTDNGAITGQLVTNTEIEDMPLNGGRDFTTLAQFVPGVMLSPPGSNGSAFAINGARSDNTNFYLDGVDDRNVRGAAAQYRPNIDALQEFNMEVGGYSAEYGKMAGGILNMSLKSGTNEYHGTLFDYFRNTIFDAKSYFSTSNLPYHLEQFGGVISGPLVIPHLYDGRNRTFFMVSEESLLNPYGEVGLGNVPTALQQAGNFSQEVNSVGAPVIIKNPYASNAPFPGDIIPQSMFSPVAAKLLQFYPLPNRTALGDNYLSNVGIQDNYDGYVFRVDHRFNDKDSLSVRFGKRWAQTNAPFGESNLGLFVVTTEDDRSLGGIEYTHLFSSTLLTDFHFGLSRAWDQDHQAGSFPTAAQLGMSGSTTGVPGDPAGFPTINVTGYLALGYTAASPDPFAVTNYTIGDKFAWVKGAHTIKFGGEQSRNRWNESYFNNLHGTMTANGIWSGGGTATNGDGIADLELGLLNTSTIAKQYANNYMRLSEPSVFITDDWKAMHNLTLNLGLRYEIDTPPSDLYGRETNFIPQYGKIALANPANIPNYSQEVTALNLQNLVVPMSQLGLSSLISTYHKGFAPRFGFAWQPFGDGKTVIRGGYGIFYSGNALGAVRTALDDEFPVVLGQSFTRVAATPSDLTLANPWNQAIATQSGTTTSSGYQSNPTMGYMQEYSLKFERELGGGTVFEAGYVGSKGTHLGQEYNLNQPIYSIAAYEQTGTFQSPYPQLSTITYLNFRANSIYNAGQFTLRKQSSHGFFYRISYTYAKSIDDTSQFNEGSSTMGFAGALNVYDLGLDRARSDFDRRHTFQSVFAYSLPVGRGKQFLANSGALVDGILGGWQLSSTSFFASGLPITIENSTATATTNPYAIRPNRIANGAETNGQGRRGIDYPWFNPADFPAVPTCASRTNCSPDQYGFLPFTPGNSGRGILDGPGLANIDMSLTKNWAITEHKRFQFRFEVFNIFNHPNFTLLDRNANDAAGGYLTTAAINTGGGGTNGGGGNRVMEFALKFYF